MTQPCLVFAACLVTLDYVMRPAYFKIKSAVTVIAAPALLSAALSAPPVLAVSGPLAGALGASALAVLWQGPAMAQEAPRPPGMDPELAEPDLPPELNPEMAPPPDLGPAPDPGDSFVVGPDADEGTLLQQLAEAEDPAAAFKIERELQALWRRSGSASMDLLFRRGRDAMEAQDLTAAIEHFTALTDHAPGFAEGWHARATAYFHADLYGPAVADLERTLALNPNNYRAIFGLGTILETFGDEKRAYEAYLRAKAINPHFEDVTDALDRLRPGVEGRTL